MISSVSRLIAITLLWFQPMVANAEPYNNYNAIPTAEATSIPAGWVQFCERYPQDCLVNQGPDKVLLLTPALEKKIQSLNREVNRKIKMVTDSDHFGVIDDWNYPNDGKGDCEDIALHKRRLLLKMGVPPEALALAVVETQNDTKEKHAVLILKTDSGDFVLDNLTDNFKNWQNTNYKFNKMQSSLDPNEWLTVKTVKSARQELYQLIEETAAR